MLKSHFKPIYFIILLFLIYACENAEKSVGNKNNEEATEAVTVINVSDIGNNIDGSDILVTFDKITFEIFLSEYRIMVVKETSSEQFELEDANMIESDMYTKVSKNGINIAKRLDDSAKDIDGDIIKNNVSYVIYVLSIADGENAQVNALSSPSGSFMLTTNVEAVASIQVEDIGSELNGQDLQVSFDKIPHEEFLLEYRMIAVKTSVSGFNALQATNLTVGNYKNIAKTGQHIQVSFDANSKDSEGDLIQNDTFYRVYVLSVADGIISVENVLSTPSDIIKMTSVTESAKNVKISDVRNFGNASDIRLSFSSISNENMITEYRGIIVKSESANTFTLANANDLTSDKYTIIPKTGSNIDFRFDASAKDIDGELINDNNDYKVFVLSVADGVSTIESSLSLPTTSLNLEITNLVITITPSINIGSGGMDVDNEGNIYAADFGSALSGGSAGTFIYKITPEGVATQWASGLVGASGNDFDSQGYLLQSNIGNNTMVRISPAGGISQYLGPNSGLNSPVGVVADPNDTLYVANCGNNSILKVAPDRTTSVFVTNTSNLLSCPNGITMDEDGNLYIANFNNANVIKITKNRTQSILASTAGTNGHILYGNNVLYVVGRTANRIYKVTLDGQVTVLAGTGGRGLRDGSALEATLSLTNDLALSPDGKELYFNDVVNLTGSNILQPVAIRKIVLDAEGL